MESIPIVAMRTFIEAIRDTGYKSTGSAIAELIDNAFEAKASHVQISIDPDVDRNGEVAIRVTDDGVGMNPEVLRIALQFGGSTRFDSRAATGRYGMGLPNGGLSQARRLEVFSWTTGSPIWSSYLDVDEIVSLSMREVPGPRVAPLFSKPSSSSGTTVVLSKCDRVDCKQIETLALKLAIELGRVFRKFLSAGRTIIINGRQVEPTDPLFVASGGNISGARLYGRPLEYKVRVPITNRTHAATSVVSVIFSELPIEEWHKFSNRKKNDFGISKGAGVSIVRAGREIDHGWYFMGAKRRENYDDWWRCEVNFSPDLDELFGVTHSKQKINPTVLISSILTPEIERIARELNGRVRRKYANIKSKIFHSRLLKRLQAKDHLLEPPPHRRPRGTQAESAPEFRLLRKRNDGVNGLDFVLSHKPEEHSLFFAAQLHKGVLSLIINERHPFYSVAYRQLGRNQKNGADPLQYVLLLLVSFARAECALNRTKDHEIIKRLRQAWSDTVAAFLS